MLNEEDEMQVTATESDVNLSASEWIELFLLQPLTELDVMNFAASMLNDPVFLPSRLRLPISRLFWQRTMMSESPPLKSSKS